METVQQKIITMASLYDLRHSGMMVLGMLVQKLGKADTATLTLAAALEKAGSKSRYLDEILKGRKR